MTTIRSGPRSAEDFCYLVTQRRPRATLDITANDDDAGQVATKDRAGVRRSAGAGPIAAVDAERCRARGWLVRP
jgi:hypothetical protein